MSQKEKEWVKALFCLALAGLVWGYMYFDARKSRIESEERSQVFQELYNLGNAEMNKK